MLPDYLCCSKNTIMTSSIHSKTRRLVYLCFGILLTACQRNTVLKTNEGHQLPPPQVQAEQLLFFEKTRIKVASPPASCQIYYTMDGSIPDKNSPILLDELDVRETSTLLFRTIGEGQLSDISRLDVFKVVPNRLTFAQGHTPGLAYEQSNRVLTDTRKGLKEDHSIGWWGYQQETINLVMDMKGGAVHGLALSFLEDQSNGVFGPSEVTVSFYDAVGNLLAVTQKAYACTDKKTGAQYRFLRLPTPTFIYPTQVSIEITNLPAIPEGYPHAGEVPSLLMDEVLIWGRRG